jgi:hypothetical protein
MINVKQNKSFKLLLREIQQIMKIFVSIFQLNRSKIIEFYLYFNKKYFYNDL